MRIYACVRGIVGELRPEFDAATWDCIQMIDPAWQRSPAIDWSSTVPIEPMSVPIITLRRVGCLRYDAVFIYGDEPPDLIERVRAAALELAAPTDRQALARYAALRFAHRRGNS